MPDHPLYLFKTARRPMYKKENLDLLAAERGTVMEFSWNRSWVAPEYFDEGAIPRGAPAFFVLTDRPYDRFVPARAGEVVSAAWDDVMLRLKVLLKNPVGIEDDDMDLRTYTRVVKKTDPDCAPPHKFVAPKRDGVELVPFFDEREIPGWRRSVDHLLEMSEASEDHPYRSSVFFRPRGVAVGEDRLVPSRRAVLEPGERAVLRLCFHNPHLEPGDVADLSLALRTPGDGLEAEDPPAIPLEDDVEIELRALEGGEPEIRIELAPAPAQHTSLMERFQRAGEEEKVEVEEGERADSDELVALFHTVLRNTEMRSHAEELDVLNAFQRVLPRHQEIRERKATVLLEQGKEDDAFAILRRLNRELLGDRARFFLFRHRRAGGGYLYCERGLGGSGEVDHFIPWRRYPTELGHNFVLAHGGCNARKGDRLAAEEHLARWRERNEGHRGVLGERFDRAGVLHDWVASFRSEVYSRIVNCAPSNTRFRNSSFSAQSSSSPTTRGQISFPCPKSRESPTSIRAAA